MIHRQDYYLLQIVLRSLLLEFSSFKDDAHNHNEGLQESDFVSFECLWGWLYKLWSPWCENIPHWTQSRSLSGASRMFTHRYAVFCAWKRRLDLRRSRQIPPSFGGFCFTDKNLPCLWADTDLCWVTHTFSFTSPTDVPSGKDLSGIWISQDAWRDWVWARL